MLVTGLLTDNDLGEVAKLRKARDHPAPYSAAFLLTRADRLSHNLNMRGRCTTPLIAQLGKLHRKTESRFFRASASQGPSSSGRL